VAQGPGRATAGSEPVCSGLRVVILTTCGLAEYVRPALTDTPAERPGDAVRTVAEGHAPLPPTVTRRLIDSPGGARRRPPTAPGRSASLTPREDDVLITKGRGTLPGLLTRCSL
jgi:DNA-binding NarL/FixJ family response regulator